MKYEPIISDRYYHIYNQGNNKENIFKEEKNYNYFLKLLIKHVVKYSDIYCYCLLKNHFHLIIKTKEKIEDKKIQQSFSNFFNAYSKSINKSYNRSGSLFRDRFKRKIIENENYFKQLIIYIHLNPQNHHLINDFRDYKHSSYQSIISDSFTNLKRNEVIELYDDKENFIFVHDNFNNSLDLKF